VPVTDTDRGYRKRVAAIIGAGPVDTIVGVIGEKASADHEGITVGELAEIHEFGLGVPERSFLRAWFDQNREKVIVRLRAAHRKVLLGELTPQRAGEIIGLWAVGEIQRFIADGKVKPALDPRTVVAKGSSVPLIDTGQLRSAISYAVEARLR
jgi:hypothetical protein